MRWLLRVLFIITDERSLIGEDCIIQFAEIGTEGSEARVARGRLNGGSIGLAGMELNGALVLAVILIQDDLIIIGGTPGALRLRSIVLSLLGPMLR